MAKIQQNFIHSQTPVPHPLKRRKPPRSRIFSICPRVDKNFLDLYGFKNPGYYFVRETKEVA